MKRKTLRTIWITVTVLALFFLASYSNKNSEVSASLIGFLELIVIVTSILSFRKIVGPNIKNKVPFYAKRSLNPLLSNNKSVNDLSIYTNINSYTVPQETYQEHAGRIGEDRISKELSKFGIGRKIIRNLIIGNNHTTTEIDCVFITECGIYVIESKNFNGWIFGNLTQQNWTQSFPNQTKNHFFNPILQNQGHINALRHLLNQFPEIEMISVIVFSDSANLKKIPESTNDLLIIKESDVFKIIESSVENNKKYKPGATLTPDQIYRVWDYLNQYNIESFKKRDKHLENVKSKKNID